MPAVTTITSLFLILDKDLPPEMEQLKFLTAPLCPRSNAFPLARPSITSTKTISPNDFEAIKEANSPPIFPAPIKLIFANKFPLF